MESAIGNGGSRQRACNSTAFTLLGALTAHAVGYSNREGGYTSRTCANKYAASASSVFTGSEVLALAPECRVSWNSS